MVQAGAKPSPQKRETDPIMIPDERARKATICHSRKRACIVCLKWRDSRFNSCMLCVIYCIEIDSERVNKRGINIASRRTLAKTSSNMLEITAQATPPNILQKIQGIRDRYPSQVVGFFPSSIYIPII